MIAFAAIAYGGATILGGSGFITAYVTGLFLSNYSYANPRISAAALQEVLAPFNTVMEVLIFLVFGLSTDPRNALQLLPAGVLVALALMLIARPLSVLLFQPLSPFSRRESLLVAWCGPRGAVQLALALELEELLSRLVGDGVTGGHALAAGLEGIVVTVVVLNLLLQGLSLPWLCRRLGLTGEDPGDAVPPATALVP